MNDNLKIFRDRIDQLDSQLIELLSERAEAARSIGKAKLAKGEPIFVPNREQIVFDKVCSRNKGPLTDATLKAIWREIMSGCIALEKPLTIAHFAQTGSFTWQAAKRKFGESVKYTAIESVKDVFDEIEKGHAEYGVVPIENSTDGSITDTIDCFLDCNLLIINELKLLVKHHIMAKCDLSSVKKIYSKHTVFGQCRNWLATNMPSANLIEVESTTVAADIASKEEFAASIGNIDTAEEFGLSVLESNLQDNINNTTRFIILAKEEKAAAPTGNDKTSIMFSVNNSPGVLYESLLPFSKAKIDLSRIESRPSRKKLGEYLFFIDILGHKEDENIAAALKEFSNSVSMIKILGSYPVATQAINEELS